MNFKDYLKTRNGSQNESHANIPVFEILHNGVALIRSERDNVISNKLKTKKYQTIIDELRIFRYDKYGSEDITDLFIK